MLGFLDVSKYTALTTVIGEDGALVIDVSGLDPKLPLHANDLLAILEQRKLTGFTAVVVRSGETEFARRPSKGNLRDHVAGQGNWDVALDDDVYHDVVAARAFAPEAFVKRDGMLVYDADKRRNHMLDDLTKHGAVVRHGLAAFNRPILFPFNGTDIPCQPGMSLSAIRAEYNAIIRQASARAAAEKKARTEAAIGGPLDDPALILVVTGQQNGQRVFFRVTSDRFGKDRFVPEFLRATHYTHEDLKNADLDGHLKSVRERFGATVQDIRVERVTLAFAQTGFGNASKEFS